MIEVLLEGWSPLGRDRIVQAARDGRWEEARSVAVPADADRARSLVREAGPADVSVEFEWLGRPLVFVGARRAPEDEEFEEAVVRVAALNPDDPAVALSVLAGGDPAELSEIELGAANAWQSVGPLRLWTRGEGRVPGALAARLRDHPALARCIAPVALELAFRGPRSCWIGVEVSEPSGGEHVVTASTVETALARILSA